jgi:hypothetical protein
MLLAISPPAAVTRDGEGDGCCPHAATTARMQSSDRTHPY